MVDFKFKLSNLPKYMTPERVQSAAADLLGVQPTTVSARKRAHSDYAFLTVAHSDEAVSCQGMLAKLNQGRIEGAKVIAVEDTYCGDKPKGGENPAGKRMRLKAPDKNKTLADQVTSLWRIPYQEQLAMKKESLLKALAPLFKKHEAAKLEDVLPSPITTGYRNKVEYTFGVNRDGKPTVGLCLGGFVNGSNAVDSPHDLLHIPAVLSALATHTQAFMDAHPELPVWNVVSKTGFWRLLLCRVHGDGQVMVGLQLNEMTEGIDKDSVMKEIVEHYKSFEHDNIKIASFQVQYTAVGHSGLDMKRPFVVLFGSDFVQERLNSLTFKVSPLSFFQNNIPATILLYDTVKQFASESTDVSDSTLLDLCCGTGTIGMYLQDRFTRVIGVELVPEAIADAKENSIANNLQEKCTFICARVEDAIGSLLHSSKDQKLTVVLDPPRAGCAASVIAAVRKCESISRVVFVACEAALSAHNMMALIEDGNGDGGGAFRVTRMQPVDLFPHTPHCELVVQFDR